MSDFQDNAPVQLKPIKACAQIIAERDRYRQGFDEVSRAHQATLARVAELEKAMDEILAYYEETQEQGIPSTFWRIANAAR